MRLLLPFLLTLFSGVIQANNQSQPIKIKVVVVTMFEIGEDEGDKPGEFQMWKERENINTRYSFPQGFHDLYVNEQKGLLTMVTGMGTARASAAILGLGLDPRFDLTQAYWLVAGIAGIDPQDGTIGSAVWADYLIDGDLAHQIDAREIPTDWSTGYFPLFETSPYARASAQQSVTASNGEMYQLNSQLVHWAANLTKDIALVDTEAMQALRSRYTGYPKALGKPAVLIGSQLAASTFWHGKLLNQWANDWTSYWTNGAGNFITSGMEDTGSYQAMLYLDNAGRADKDRFMVLRTASNFTMQPPGLSAAENLAMESSTTGYAGMTPSLEAAHKVGSKVVHTLIDNWDKYQNQIPD